MAWLQAFQPDWRQFQPLVALYCLPGLLGVLVIGQALGQKTPALVGATGALVVGFGALQNQFLNPRTPMIAVALGSSLSAGVGTLANAWLPADLLCTALWGIGLGLMNLTAPGPGWLALQGAIALVVAASFPATPQAAAYRLLLVLGGAAVQICFVLLLSHVAPRPFQTMRAQQAQPVTVMDVLRQARDILLGRRGGLAYVLTIGGAVTVAEVVGHRLDIRNGYWVAMTVLLVLRPDIHETYSRAMLRLTGTAIGAGVITLVVALLRPSPLVIILLIGLATWACFALVRVNYALLSFAVTGYVVLLFALAGLPEPAVALDRTIATALGGAIAAVAHLTCRWMGVWLAGTRVEGCR